jgi:hypothetical protein
MTLGIRLAMRLASLAAPAMRRPSAAGAKPLIGGAADLIGRATPINGRAAAVMTHE